MLSTAVISARPGFCYFILTATASTVISTLSLHDALPIWAGRRGPHGDEELPLRRRLLPRPGPAGRPHRIHRGGRFRADRKSTRLNSSHVANTYAVFCLKKKRLTCLRTQ